MPSPLGQAIVCFRRRVAIGAFVGGMLQAICWLGLGWAATLLAVRVCGGYLPPAAWWSAWALPVLACGWWRLRAERMPAAVVAAHLDRRLGLDGLLLSASEVGASEVGATEGPTLDATWTARLHQGLAHLPQVLPRLRWRQLLPLPFLALVLASGVAMLPAPYPPPAEVPVPALRAELETLAATMRDLFERGQVPDEVKQELQQKLAELQRKVEAGEVPEWRDLDQFDQRLEREQLLQAVREPGAKPGGAGEAAATERTEAPTPGQLAAAAKALVDSGLLDRLPGELRSTLQKARNDDGSFDPSLLPQDPKALAKLAEAMAGAAGKLGEGQLGAGLDPGQLADLQEVLKQFGHGAAQQPGAGGQGQGDGPGEGEQGGRGGVDRGPGHSVLSMTEDAQGGADNVLPLPPGRALPGDWVPLGSAKSEPSVQPEPYRQAGSAGASGPGGASWQLDLAPRHRAVLRRFFAASAAEPAKDKR